MNLLLDTHALLWYVTNDERLSNKSLNAVNDKANVCTVSVVRLWEITVKVSLQKLELKTSLDNLVLDLKANDINVIGIHVSHLNALRELPLHHRDPFDRLIVAQAKAENLVLVTNDKALAAYGAETLW